MEDQYKTKEQLLRELAELRQLTDRKKAEEALRDNEEDYRRLTELLPDSIFVVNGDCIAFVNSAGLRLLGASHIDQIVGRPVLDFIHPEDQAAIKNRMQSTFEGKWLAQWMEQRAVRLDGSVVDIEAIAVPFVHRGCLTSQVIVRDITDRKKAEEALQDSQQRQKAILDTIPDPAWLKDKEGRFLAVNAAWCRFFGLDARSVLGKTAFEFLPAEVAEHFGELDRNLMQSRQKLQLEELLADKDGVKVWFDAIVSPLFNDHGDVVGTTGLARDITARKRAEEEAAKSKAFLTAAIECLPFEFFALAPDGHCILQNAVSRQYYGNAVGKTAEEVCPDEHALPRWLAKLGQVADGKRIAEEVELQVKREARHFYSISVPIRDGEMLYGMLGVNVDISDRKRAEKELAQSKALLEATIENLPFDFFAIGPDGRYILQNDTSKQHWGDAIGKFPRDVCLNSVELALWLDNNRRAFNGGKVEGKRSLPSMVKRDFSTTS